MAFLNTFANGAAGLIPRTLINSLVTRSNQMGWGDYVDTQYTDIAPLQLLTDTDTPLPNNALSGPRTQEPITGPLYDPVTQKIQGTNGDNLFMTFEVTAVPTSASSTLLEVWVDIGAPIGQLYRRLITFPKGQGIARPASFTVAGYTLGTWETNGGDVYIRGNGTFDVYGIRFLLQKTYIGH